MESYRRFPFFGLGFAVTLAYACLAIGLYLGYPRTRILKISFLTLGVSAATTVVNYLAGDS